MTTYKEIFGKYIKNYSSDPTDDVEGQVWYNSTTGVFKTNVSLGAVWASGGSLGTARYGLAGAGSQTAALGFGGYSTAGSAATEEFTGETSAFNFKTLTTS